jgi:2-methylisocitrate lyase-like PEP mutase family enzyme
MADQARKADHFRTLHVAGKPLVLCNIWDAGSAKAVAAAGAKAIATGSWSVAHANGFDDGESLPLDLAIDNLRRIVAATELPVTIDLESGYGRTSADVAETIRRAIDGEPLAATWKTAFRPMEDSARSPSRPIASSMLERRQKASGIHFFINARTDVFFQRSVPVLSRPSG